MLSCKSLQLFVFLVGSNSICCCRSAANLDYMLIGEDSDIGGLGIDFDALNELAAAGSV